MKKLIIKWVNSPNMENAIKLVAYDKKHTMASCMLLPCEILLLKDAHNFVNMDGISDVKTIVVAA